jgi:hypothetical protein
VHELACRHPAEGLDLTREVSLIGIPGAEREEGQTLIRFRSRESLWPAPCG